MHVWDLNFVLRSKNFVHWDGQPQASHLILGFDPMYSTWQAFNQALLVDNPLLSYIDVQHANFFPPRLTVGEARDLGPQHTCSDELAPIRDESAEHVSQRRHEQAHVLVQPEALIQLEAPIEPKEPVEPKAPVQEAVEEPAKHIGFDIESDRGEDMVTQRTVIVSCFMPGARLAA